MRVEAVAQGVMSLDDIKKVELQLNRQNMSAETVQAFNQSMQTQLSEMQNGNQKSDILDKNLLKDPEELKKLMKELQAKLSYLNSQLKIEIDSEINQPIVKIMDINTNQVIRQIPPDYMINIIKNINKLLGVLFEERV